MPSSCLLSSKTGEVWVIERGPNLLMPIAGDGLELRLPDGRGQQAIVGGFGVEAWPPHKDSYLYTADDLSHPFLTLSIAGDFRTEDIPPGTEIWLSEAK